MVAFKSSLTAQQTNSEKCDDGCSGEMADRLSAAMGPTLASAMARIMDCGESAI